MGKPQLIITADDYGMSPLFNAGILEASRAGLVTGISVMIKRKYIRKMELLALGIPLGLHLELHKNSPSQEIINQIRRFQKRFGRLPTYLDGHQHQHLTPEHISHVIRAAKKYHLPVRSRFHRDRTMLKQAGIPTPATFIAWHPTRLADLHERLERLRRAAEKESLVELVVHPGYFDQGCHYPYNREREQELAFLKSPVFKQLLTNFQLISYSTR